MASFVWYSTVMVLNVDGRQPLIYYVAFLALQILMGRDGCKMEKPGFGLGHVQNPDLNPTALPNRPSSSVPSVGFTKEKCFRTPNTKLYHLWFY